MTDLRALMVGMFSLLAVFAGPAASAETSAVMQDPGHVVGQTDAPLTIVEYGSPTCSLCQNFHRDIFHPVLAPHIESGRVKFVFREFIRNDIDTAIMAIGRCAGRDRFFDVLDDAFQSREAIISAARAGNAVDALVGLSERHGIEGESGFEACFSDISIRLDIATANRSAEILGVQGTPTLIVNGKLKGYDADLLTADAFSAYLEQELASVTIAGH